MIEAILVFSILMNCFLVWYVIQLLRRFLAVSDNLENFFSLIEEYMEHVKIVHDLERFYGDSTLQNLMNHSKAMVNAAHDLRLVYDENYEFDEEEYMDEE